MTLWQKSPEMADIDLRQKWDVVDQLRRQYDASGRVQMPTLTAALRALEKAAMEHDAAKQVERRPLERTA